MQIWGDLPPPSQHNFSGRKLHREEKHKGDLEIKKWTVWENIHISWLDYSPMYMLYPLTHLPYYLYNSTDELKMPFVCMSCICHTRWCSSPCCWHEADVSLCAACAIKHFELIIYSTFLNYEESWSHFILIWPWEALPRHDHWWICSLLAAMNLCPRGWNSVLTLSTATWQCCWRIAHF